MSLRSTAREFIKFDVGDGKLIHLWLDNWHPFGPLYEKYGFRIIYDSQSSLEAKMNYVIRNGRWSWRPTRSEELVDIQSKPPDVPLGNVDKPIWTLSRKGVYVSADTWKFMRKRKLEISWWSVVWFSQAIPKQAFILWLAVLNRLTTGERLVTWGYQGDTQCFFCRNGVESREHLFFSCSFSSRIWKTCMNRCFYQHPPLDWQSVLEEACRKWRTKKLQGVLCKLILRSTVYHIWRTRNEIKAKGHPKTEEQLLRLIFWEVRNRISGKGKFIKSMENVAICQMWNLDESLLV